MTAKKTTSTRRRSEELATEANVPARPKGSPELVPFAALPRRQRAEFLRHMAKVASAEEHIRRIAEVSDDGEYSIADGAAMLELVADMEDTLAVVAKDPEAFRTWASQASDDAISELTNWYLARFQPGEAKAS